MKKLFLRSAALVAAFAIVGCSQVETGPTEDVETRLGEKTDVDVAAWLKLSRPELAKLSDEWAAAVKNDIEAYRKAPDAVELLPRLYPPVRVPIFREASLSPSMGVSLPPYLSLGERDAAVALHVARFGDHEAAVKLLPPGDADLLKRIDACRGEKDYPLEWSRLVGLLLTSSQLKLASGDVEAATRLVLVHQQLLATLDVREGRAARLGPAVFGQTPPWPWRRKPGGTRTGRRSPWRTTSIKP